MKDRWLIPALASLLLLTAASAKADTVNVLSGNAAWNSFETPSANNSGTAFWNRWSFDGAQHDCNIGYWLSGQGGCGANKGQFKRDALGITPEFLGDKNTAWDMQKDTSTESVTVTSFLEVTSYRDSDEFGWYNTSTPDDLNMLFSGAGNVYASATFFPSGNYGFYLRSPEGLYLTNGTGDNRTHFAMFRLNESGDYIMGVEDMWRGADWDYNDVIYRVTTAQVPEPTSLAVFGCGLVGLAMAVRRRRQHA